MSSFNASIALTITHHPKISPLDPFERSVSTFLCFAVFKKHCFDKKKKDDIKKAPTKSLSSYLFFELVKGIPTL